MEPAAGMAVGSICLCGKKLNAVLSQLPDEVSQAVANRSGAILSAQTVGLCDKGSGVDETDVNAIRS